MGKNKNDKTKTQMGATELQTAPPTGVALTRSGNTMHASWNIATPNNTVTKVWWYLNGNLVRYAELDPSATSDTLPFDPNQRIYNIRVGVAEWEATASETVNQSYKNKKGGTTTVVTTWYAIYSQSETAYAQFDFARPAKPSVSFALDTSVANKGTFSYSAAAPDDGAQMFTKLIWQTVVKNNWNSSNPPGSWASGSESRSNEGSQTFIETSGLTNPNSSFTRWFRVKAVGPGGESDWTPLSHTYAMPKEADSVKGKASVRKGNAGYVVSAAWNVPNSFEFPCDTVTVNYAAAEPTTSATVENNKKIVSWTYPGTSSPSWTAVNTLSDTNGMQSYCFTVPSMLSDDEVMWLRIDSKHDNNVTNGIPVRVEGAASKLAAPSLTEVSVSTGTRRATVKITHGTSVENTFCAVLYRSADADPIIVGIIPYGSTQGTFVFPEFEGDSPSIGLQEYLADYSPVTWPSSSDVTIPTIENVKMQSDIVWIEGAIPIPPSNVELTALNTEAINVKWDWTWTAASNAELSWADHDDAWKSTDEPSTYELGDLYDGDWNIAGLGVGTWYVRVRLGRLLTSGNINWSLYSNMKAIKLASAPAIPSLVLSAGAVTLDDFVSCYWAYVSTDGTGQMQADICEATWDSTNSKWVYGTPFARAESAQHITFSPKDLGWQTGSTHNICVRVISQSGETSEGWSTPVAVQIVEPISCSITDISLEEMTFEEEGYTLTADMAIVDGKTYYDENGDPIENPTIDHIDEYYEPITRTVLGLTEMPLEVTVSGAGYGSTTSVIIERSKDFHMRRPDDTELDGYEGEVVFSRTYNNDGQFSIETDELTGYLDDRASYRIIAIAKDSFGQTAETSVEFEVHWEHQAIVPTATVTIDAEHEVAVLTPTLPDGAVLGEGDVCDIYRLSIDPPQLIYSGAEFGEKYVDMYTALGWHSGYRFVYRTVNGDYTTESGKIAWYNTTEHDNNVLDGEYTIVNFKGNRLSLPYNITIDHKWKKDFTETKYLGGHVQGDWNPAVSRNANIGSAVLDGENFDLDTVEAVRALAVHPGVCHIRTPEGSSFACNIDVSEKRDTGSGKQIAGVTLDITRVDSPGLECITYAEWQAMLEEGEES